jgi:hypothetical protein
VQGTICLDGSPFDAHARRSALAVWWMQWQTATHLICQPMSWVLLEGGETSSVGLSKAVLQTTRTPRCAWTWQRSFTKTLVG